MMDSVPDPNPLPFYAEPANVGRTVWIRFPLPVGSKSLKVSVSGEECLWIDGKKTELINGTASFPAQMAGTTAALRLQS
jgi:hypothetical protein